MARLTQMERRLLAYPPTTGTWICRAKTWKTLDGVERLQCGTPNGEWGQVCWLCGSKKPRKPKLLYPAYLAACQKAGVEPGTRIRMNEPVTTAKAKKGRA